MEQPGLLALGVAFLGGLGFVRRDDEQGFLGLLLGQSEALTLDLGEDLFRILEGTCRGHDVVVRDRQGYLVVAEFQRELPGAEELFVNPAGVVRVGGHARKPLCDGVDAIAVFFEVLVARAGHDALRVIDRVGPGDLEDEVRTGLEGFGQIEAQHRLHDRVWEAAPLGVGQLCDFQCAVVGFVGEHPVEGAVGKLLQVDAALGVGGHAGVGALGEIILVQLDPKVVERIGRGVVVGNRRFGRDGALLVVELGADIIVGAILPIAGTRGAGGEALGGGRGQERIQLLELLDRCAGLGRECDQGEEEGEEASHARTIGMATPLASGCSAVSGGGARPTRPA